MKNRKALAKHFAELGFKIGAEIGIAEGYFSEVICKQNRGVRLFCIDSWLYYKGYRDFRKRSQYNGLEKRARERLEPFGCIVIKKFSMDAVKDFKDESLDFVYIDAHHGYDYVKEDIREWTKKVRKGGIVSGHDYYIMKSGNDGVVRAVNEYVKKYGYELNLTDKDRKNPLPDERQQNWYFYKK